MSSSSADYIYYSKFSHETNIPTWWKKLQMSARFGCRVSCYLLGDPALNRKYLVHFVSGNSGSHQPVVLHTTISAQTVSSSSREKLHRFARQPTRESRNTKRVDASPTQENKNSPLSVTRQRPGMIEIATVSWKMTIHDME